MFGNGFCREARVVHAHHAATSSVYTEYTGIVGINSVITPMSTPVLRRSDLATIISRLLLDYLVELAVFV